MLMMSERVEDRFFMDTNDDSEEGGAAVNLPVKRKAPTDDNEWQFSHQLALQKKKDDDKAEAADEETLRDRVKRTLAA